MHTGCHRGSRHLRVGVRPASEAENGEHDPEDEERKRHTEGGKDNKGDNDKDEEKTKLENSNRRD